MKSLGRTRGYTKAIKDDEKTREKAETNQRQIRTLFVKGLTEFIEKLKQQFPNSLNIHDVVAQPERLILVRWMN